MWYNDWIKPSYSDDCLSQSISSSSIHVIFMDHFHLLITRHHETPANFPFSNDDVKKECAWRKWAPGHINIDCFLISLDSILRVHFNLTWWWKQQLSCRTCCITLCSQTKIDGLLWLQKDVLVLLHIHIYRILLLL